MHPSVSRKGDWLGMFPTKLAPQRVYSRRGEFLADVTTGVRYGRIRRADSRNSRAAQAPRWRADGHELFYLSSSAGSNHGSAGVPTTIGSRRAFVPGRKGRCRHGMCPRDGERFLLAVPARTSQPAPFSVVLKTGRVDTRHASHHESRTPAAKLFRISSKNFSALGSFDCPRPEHRPACGRRDS
jgi:hypothetical protein